MKHFVCPECKESLTEIGVCEKDSCPNQWEMMIECNCSDSLHGAQQVTKDCHGKPLQNGDSVTLIKDLTLRGSSQKIKQGTKVTKIKLTDNPEEIDCKINGTAIVLRTEFLKKI